MKPRIVCNTGPLIALSLIDCQFVLSRLYDPLIPSKVIEEWAAGEDAHPGTLPESCEIVEVTVANPFLALQLDAGEASVIQAAIDFKIGMVLMDERKGRKLARRLCGLVTLGTAGLLVQAKRAGILDEVAPLFGKLEAASYWISPTIVNWAIQQAGE